MAFLCHGPLPFSLDHLSCLSLQTRWTKSVHLLGLENYILGTLTFMVPLPFYSLYKRKLSRDNFNIQSAALQNPGPTSWSIVVNRPLIRHRVNTCYNEIGLSNHITDPILGSEVNTIKRASMIT